MVLAPELVGLLASLLLVCALMALSFAYTYTFGALLKALASLLDVGISIPYGPTLHPFSFIGGALNDLDNTIRNGLGTGIQYAQYGFNKTLHAVAYSIQEIGNTLEALASDTRSALHGLRVSVIPTLIGAALGPLAAIVYGLRHQVKAIAVAVANAAIHPGRTVVHTITNLRTVEHTIVKTVTVTVPAAVAKAVALPAPRLGWLERETITTLARLKKIGASLTPAGVLAATIAAVGTLGFGWVRCRNVGKAGKVLCGMNGDLLESLLADTLLIASTISIVEFAKNCQAFSSEVESPLVQFVRELRSVSVLRPPDASAALAAYAAGKF